jgi:hypothetical protein
MTTHTPALPRLLPLRGALQPARGFRASKPAEANTRRASWRRAFALVAVYR